MFQNMIIVVKSFFYCVTGEDFQFFWKYFDSGKDGGLRRLCEVYFKAFFKNYVALDGEKGFLTSYWDLSCLLLKLFHTFSSQKYKSSPKGVAVPLQIELMTPVSKFTCQKSLDLCTTDNKWNTESHVPFNSKEKIISYCKSCHKKQSHMSLRSAA